MLFLFACPAGAAEYYPLKEGNQLEFKHLMTMGGEKSEAMILETVLQKKDFNGGKLPVVKVTMTPVGRAGTGEAAEDALIYLQDDAEGVRMVAIQPAGDTAPRPVDAAWKIKYPLSTATSWNRRCPLAVGGKPAVVNLSCTIDRLDDTVTVKAGTFKKCLRIREYFSGKAEIGDGDDSPPITYESTRWYAPGVGMVKMNVQVRMEGSEKNMDILEELVSRKQ